MKHTILFSLLLISTILFAKNITTQFEVRGNCEMCKEKIEETKINDDPEVIDGFSVSKLDDVKDVVTKRFSI